ncbi:MAG: hypothetical protein EBT03_10520 [Betaproteobacteria bacterium]|nr:hypothetical protein [Betaproteobacteria bacterium]NCA16893.1 hypothetical protein [Betaproteobacteria bacterium]
MNDNRNNDYVYDEISGLRQRLREAEERTRKAERAKDVAFAELERVRTALAALSSDPQSESAQRLAKIVLAACCSQ